MGRMYRECEPECDGYVMMNKSETISPQIHEDTKVDLRRAGLSAAGNQRSTTPGAPGINDQRPTGLGTAGGSGQRIPARWNKVLVAGRQGRAAFTLIEILVVLSIIVLLIAILVPAAILAERYAYSSATQGDLAAIGQALSMYHTDFNMYPDSDLCGQGAAAPNLYYNPTPPAGVTSVTIPQGRAYDYLAECLLGYLPGWEDGYPASGPGYTGTGIGSAFPNTAGFTMQPYKKVYGPYMPVNAQNITLDGTGNYYFSGDFPPTAGTPLPILYFSATTSPSGPIPGQGGGIPVFGATPGAGIFCYADDSGNAPSSQQFFQLIGVESSAGTAYGNSWNNASGGTIMGRNSYLLVAPGPSQNSFGADSLVYGGQ